jgi:hypothetical protein
MTEYRGIRARPGNDNLAPVCSGMFDSMLGGLLGSVRAVAVQPILIFQTRHKLFGWTPIVRS